MRGVFISELICDYLRMAIPFTTIQLKWRMWIAFKTNDNRNKTHTFFFWQISLVYHSVR